MRSGLPNEGQHLSWTSRALPTDVEDLPAAAGEPVVPVLVGALGARTEVELPAVGLHAEAERGDPVAGELIRWAGRELGSLATGVVRQLGLEAAAFDLVLIGSLFRGGPRLIQAVEKAVRPVAAHARLVRLKAGSLAFAAREPAPPSSRG